LWVQGPNPSSDDLYVAGWLDHALSQRRLGRIIRPAMR
jgi:hypothetical protein